MSWSLAITPPNREFAIARTLTRWSFPNHVFKVRRRIVQRGSATERLFPAFPGYVFVMANGAWRLLQDVFGVLAFVKNGDRIAELPDRIVTSLREASTDDVLEEQIPAARFAQGDRVRIGGMTALSQQDGFFERMAAPLEAIVMIDWMGRWVPVAVDERDLMLVQPPLPPARRRWRNRKSARRRKAEELQLLA